jgi:putative Ca2+/H+ antiporter (TMEM165/GDT1 family)
MIIEKTYLALFVTVFVAELGDKTQLVTMLSAAEGSRSAWGVFLASSLALVVSSAAGTLAGTALSSQLQALPMKLIAGACFVALGLWTIHSHYRAS